MNNTPGSKKNSILIIVIVSQLIIEVKIVLGAAKPLPDVAISCLVACHLCANFNHDPDSSQLTESGLATLKHSAVFQGYLKLSHH